MGVSEERKQPFLLFRPTIPEKRAANNVEHG